MAILCIRLEGTMQEKPSVADFKRLKKTDKLSVQKNMTTALLENRNFEDILRDLVSVRVS